MEGMNNSSNGSLESFESFVRLKEGETDANIESNTEY